MTHKCPQKNTTHFIKLALLLIFLLPFYAVALDSWEYSVEKSPSGSFDFYVYAITWQPSFCAINSLKGCSNTFKVHGIWPYFKTPKTSTIKNYHPSYCLASPGCSSFEVCEITDETVQIASNDSWLKSMLPDNPLTLMRHEWSKHGTCAGLTQLDYFFLAKTFNKKIDYKNLENLIKEKKGHILSRKEVIATLPESTSLWCKQYKGIDYLFEVHFFLDKAGEKFFETDTQIGSPCPETFIAPLIDFSVINQGR